MKLDVPCSKCSEEKEHTIIIDERTSANIVVTAKCDSCGNTVNLPLSGMPKFGGTLADRIKMAISFAKHRRNIIKGKR
jgi:hypothetical protein